MKALAIMFCSKTRMEIDNIYDTPIQCYQLYQFNGQKVTRNATFPKVWCNPAKVGITDVPIHY